jgi:hypothetical protein
MLYYSSMKNINKNSISKGFKILSIMAFSLLFVPISAGAASNYVWGTPDGVTYNSGNYNSTNYNYNPAPVYPPVYNQPAPVNNPAYNYNTPTIYSGNNTTTKSTSTTAKKTTTTTVAKANTGVPSGNLSGYMLVPVSNMQYTQTASVIDAVPYTTTTNKSLAASVILGENTFLPSGVLQWILLAILILIIVILARRIFGGTQRYLQVPLKHA